MTRAGPRGENPNGQILLYRSEDGRTKLDVRLENETVWLNQRQLTDLFGKAKGTISEHIKHIFEDGELDPRATVRSSRTVQLEGGREVVRDVEHYNLEMVLAVGFRVRGPAAVRTPRPEARGRSSRHRCGSLGTVAQPMTMWRSAK